MSTISRPPRPGPHLGATAPLARHEDDQGGASLENPFQRWGTWFTAAAVAIFLVWAAVRLGEIVDLLYRNSDNASALVLAQLIGDRGSGGMTLGHYLWLEPLYALHLTVWVPSHRLFWVAQPFLLCGATVALVWWSVRRTVSRHAALLVALAMAVPAPIVLGMLGVPNAHVWALFHSVLLAGFAVTAPSIAGWSRWRQAVWATALAVTLVPAPSDPIVLIGGVAPFLVAMASGWRLKLLDRWAAALGAAACVAGAAGGLLFKRVAESQGISYLPQDFGLTSLADAASNTRLFVEGIALFAHGRDEHSPGAIDEIQNVITLAAWVAVPLLLAGILWRARTVLTDPGRSRAQRLLAVYWGVAAFAISLAFVCSKAPENIFAIRYLTILWPALLTLSVIAWGRRALTVLVMLVSGTAILGCIDLARGRYTSWDSPPPSGREVQQLERFVENHGLDHGYAGYWDAAALTLETDYRARTYPVAVCGATGDGRCPFALHTIDSWYEPTPGVRTFYLVNNRLTEPPNDLGPPPERWGRPFRTARFGSLIVYAYNYDLAPVLAEGSG